MVVIIVTVVKKQTIEVEARQRIPDLVRNEDLLLADILRDKAGEHGDYSLLNVQEQGNRPKLNTRIRRQ